VEYCPVVYPDPFNQEISNNKAVHIYFSQAIPLITYIDESCIFLKEKKCRICEAICQNDAIDFTMEPEKIEVNVGAVILSPGIKPFDPSALKEYRYREFVNVVSSMDYERIMCATGPYQGEILRAFDLKSPQKIAWIQCIGSRQVIEGGHSYCSAVCCTYTQKQVILTKDFNPDAECTVFHNDIRSYSKDFERFYERTNNLPGINFIRSYVSIVKEDPETKNVTIRYATNDEGVKEEEFDLVVLSVGLEPPADYEELAGKFNIELNEHGFCKTNPANPMETTCPGVFACGAFQGPTDIPESVFSASGASSQCGELLDYRRGGLAEDKVYPPEKDVSKEEPRIGVFVCHCGANISRVVNIPPTVEYCQTLPNVVHAQEQLFSCASNCAQEITDMINEKGLNRVVIAACTPRTLEPLFQDTLKEAGLNPYYLEMANIREHNSWVHSKAKEEATAKAWDLIRMSVARANLLEPLVQLELPVNKAALVVGGGIAGMNCALSIAAQKHEVHLLEKEPRLGGIAHKIHETLDGMDVQAYLQDLIQKVNSHPLIHVYTEATITDVSGYVGNFVTKVQSEKGPAEIEHGAAVIATGAEVYTPTEYLYGEDERVLTHLELEELIVQKDARVTDAQSIVMIQCVGCRNEERNYCSRICCSESVKNALKLKEINPEMDVYVLFRDMRTYGFNEDYYREAADKEVRFIRYEPEAEPQIEPGTGEEDGRPCLKVTLPDYVLGKKLELDADLVALAAATIPAETTKDVAGQFMLTLNPDGFFKEAHVKLRPVEFATDGVYLCGLAHYPKFIPDTINQAYGAASRVLTLLAHDTVSASGSVCVVEEEKCMGCGACVTACTYDALKLQKTRHGNKAVVNPVLCKGDGLCNAKCPTGAIQLKHFTDDEICSMIDAFVQAEESTAKAEAVAATTE
jgi:heterodisulfide reductase subunit A